MWSFITFLYKPSYNLFYNPNILLSNSDLFFTQLDKINLIARHVTSVKEYRNKIINSIYVPNIIEQYYIHNAINNIMSKHLDDTKWLNVKLFKQLEWNIIIISNDSYETGLSHTRNKYIVLNKNIINSNSLEEILFHEQIHVYQKLHNKKISNFIDDHFVRCERRNNQRINPDTNQKSYEGYYCVFKSDTPKDLLDVTYGSDNSPKYDHPLEFLAYEYTSKYYGLLT